MLPLIARIIHGPGLGTACHDERPPRYERFRREPSVGFPLEPFGNDEFFRSTLPARDDNERAEEPSRLLFRERAPRSANRSLLTAHP
jgi:hypothetical protein